MIAAMERIQADGMDVLNMSIGDAFNNWPESPTAAAADALVDAGIVVVASIGNSGANGIYSAGAPGVGNKVIGVASFDNTHVADCRRSPCRRRPDASRSGRQRGQRRPAARRPARSRCQTALGTDGRSTARRRVRRCAAAGSLTGHRRARSARHLHASTSRRCNAQTAGATARRPLQQRRRAGFTPSIDRAGAPGGAITIPVVDISAADGDADRRPARRRAGDDDVDDSRRRFRTRPAGSISCVQLLRHRRPS